MALGRVLDRGFSPEDHEAAFAVVLPLALHGYRDAQHDVGRQMWFGHGTDRDQPGALLWYWQALRSGNLPTIGIWVSAYDTTAALLNPDGTLLQPDIAVEPDDMVPLMWHLVSFEMGQHPSRRDIYLPHYRADLSARDYARAEAMAQACVASRFVDCAWPTHRRRGLPLGLEGPLTAPGPSPRRPVQVLTRRRFIANPALRSGEKA